MSKIEDKYAIVIDAMNKEELLNVLVDEDSTEVDMEKAEKILIKYYNFKKDTILKIKENRY